MNERRHIVLVTGGRNFHNAQCIDEVLRAEAPTCVIHGACPTGADYLADAWGKANGIEVKAYPAEWTRYGLSAGPRRNRSMLHTEQPDIVIAFPGGRGTADMISAANEFGYTVMLVDP